MEFWVIVLLVVGIFLYMAWEKRKEQDRAYLEYQQSLTMLKRDPGNSDFRQHALGLGRVYSELMRDKKGHTTFDEVALLNDINAACASTQQAVHAQATWIQPESQSIESRLSTLQSLRDRGLIDDQDYTRRKQEILSTI